MDDAGREIEGARSSSDKGATPTIHAHTHTAYPKQTTHPPNQTNKQAPEPFDDMYIHPVEAVGYYCILYSPSAFFPLHPATFFAYMALLGVAGVLDHSGVRVCVALPLFRVRLYDTADHDRHHSHVSVNYSFPFPFLDVLHGTYMGECGGRHAGRER